MLKSGTHIVPHVGPTNLKLRAHLGLKIPKTEVKNNSYIRVADQILYWEEGKMIIFDDSFEHEVWHFNENDEFRIILYMDFWHPDLSEDKKVWRPLYQDPYGNLYND